MDAGNGRATSLPYPCLACTGALDRTVDWRYNIEFIRRKFRLQTLLMLEEGSHQLINERADIRNGFDPGLFACKAKTFYY